MRAVLAEVTDRAALELAQSGALNPSTLHKTVALNKAFVAARFTGNADDYYSPANSYLHSVCDRRMGIPISLSILYAAVARRFGLRAHVLGGFPQHVLVRVEAGNAPQTRWGCNGGNEATIAIAEKDLYVDPFNGFTLLKWDDLVPRFRLQVSPATLCGYVRAVDPGSVYGRLVRNVIGCVSRIRSSPADARTVGGSEDVHPSQYTIQTVKAACYAQQHAIDAHRPGGVSVEQTARFDALFSSLEENRLATMLPHAQLWSTPKSLYVP